jgi:hypothetical protein
VIRVRFFKEEFRKRVSCRKTKKLVSHILKFSKFVLGPVFGSGNDLKVDDNANANNNSYMYCGTAYECINGNQCGYLCGNYTLGSLSSYFQAAEVEVFYYSDFDSAIIPVSEQRIFLASIGYETESLTNIYRATINGFSATNFHNKIAGYYKTLTIIKTTNGNIFGYYTNAMHSNIDGFASDSGAFMFSYINSQGVKLPIIKPEMALYNNNRKYGPYFGNDTICPSDFDVNPCSLTFNAYTAPNGLPAGSAGSTYLINSTTFYPAEVEVFMLAGIPETQLIDSASQAAFMRKMLIENMRLTLIHRASQNGFSASAFHDKVNFVECV